MPRTRNPALCGHDWHRTPEATGALQTMQAIAIAQQLSGEDRPVPRELHG